MILFGWNIATPFKIEMIMLHQMPGKQMSLRVNAFFDVITPRCIVSDRASNPFQALIIGILAARENRRDMEDQL
jgi:hypothetical protein